MQTIKIRFYDERGHDLHADYDTGERSETDECARWEAWYNDAAVEHIGPKDPDGQDAWDQFEIIVE